VLPGKFQLDLERSSGIFVFLIITHTIAGLSLIPLVFPPELKVVLGFTVAVSFVVIAPSIAGFLRAGL